MSHSKLSQINQLLRKKSLDQNKVQKIENLFRAMKNIQDYHDPQKKLSDAKRDRQEAFNTFKKKVDTEGTCVISITPAELKEKGIDYTIPLAQKATETWYAISGFMQKTAQLYYAKLPHWPSNHMNVDSASNTEQSSDVIKPSHSDDPLDMMEYGVPQPRANIASPVSRKVELEGITITEDAPISSENTATPEPKEEKVLMDNVWRQIYLYGAQNISFKLKKTPQKPTVAYNQETLDKLALNINQARAVLLTYLVDEDQKKFNALYDDVMQEFDYVSLKSSQVGVYYTLKQKQAFLQRIVALEAKLQPGQLNFETKQGGLIGEQVSAWFTMKFWFFATLKSIVNAVGLRSSASFFAPAPSDAEQNNIDENLVQLRDTVNIFEGILTRGEPGSEFEIDSTPICPSSK
ncbi:MAG: hypothetical protein P1U36_03015 [Legionellaceae bacterium]|nr:hypothetical protein [Legionellaceae bacterium]